MMESCSRHHSFLPILHFYAGIFLFFHSAAVFNPFCLISGLFNSLTNTLYQNGQWMPTKVSFKKNLEGGLDFYFSRTALAQGHLNLSCWHGYQEVVYKKGITPGEIDFDFKLSENAYIVFEFNKDANQFSGIRLSTKTLV